MSVPGMPQIAALPPPQACWQEPAEKNEAAREPPADASQLTAPQHSLKRARMLGSPQRPGPPAAHAAGAAMQNGAAFEDMQGYPGKDAAPGQDEAMGHEQGSLFASEDQGVEEQGGEDDAEEQSGEWRSNDVVCGACDDGGTLLLCDGTCMRAFHGGVAEGDDGKWEPLGCNPLGCSRELFAHIQASNEPFECPNCLARVHQCFVCKKEGASDSSKGPQEVFRCINSSCGRFYHPKCVGSSSSELEDGAWVCPAHECHACQGSESEEKGEVIPCRRCPTSYHRGCLPKDLIHSKKRRVWIFNPNLEDGKDVEVSTGVVECNLQRSLLYCSQHPIEQDLFNPEHARPLFAAGLMHGWTLAVGKRYEREPWGREMLARERERWGARQAAAGAGAKVAAAAAAPARRKKLKAVRGDAMKPPTAPAGKPPKAAAARKLPKAAQAALMATLADDDDDGEDDTPLDVRAATLLRQKRQDAPRVPSTRPPALEPAHSTPLFIPLDDEAPLAPPSPAKPSAHELAPVAADPRPPPQPRSPLPDAGERADAMSGEEQGAHAEQRSASPSPEQDAAMEPEAGEPDQDVDMELLDITPGRVGAAERSSAVEAERRAQQAAADEAALLPFERESHWTKAAMKARASALWAAADEAVTLADVRQRTRQPEPYNNPPKATITKERLECLSRPVMSASQPKNLGRVGAFIGPKTMGELAQHEDNMQQSLAPLLHKDRYTSYGRHFTRHELLAVLNQQLLPHLRPGDTLVDFSAGENSWVPMLKAQCLRDGLDGIRGIAYDIITPMCLDDFRKDTWFNVKRGMLAHPDSLVIGLNPPFGRAGTLANKFVEHAATHCPRLIVLIVPPRTVTPANYSVLWEDLTLMRDRAFYVPSKPGVASWNKEAPATRILVRADCLVKTVNLHHTADDVEVIQEHCFAAQQVPMLAMQPPQMVPHHPAHPMPGMMGPLVPFNGGVQHQPFEFGLPQHGQQPPGFHARHVTYG